MKGFKKIVDERQEQELRKVESIGFWAVFWGLIVAIHVQIFTAADPEILLRQVAGELAILLLGAVVVLAGCVRKGVWSYRLKPDAKTNLLASLAAAILFSAISTLRLKITYPSVQSITLPVTFLITFASIFIMCFIALTIFAAIIKKRSAKLESSFDENDSN